MSPELDKNLCDKYSKIFINRHGDMMNTCMCWGLECDDGWYNLIDALCSNLQWDTDKNDHPQIVASQVKEKYGTLRFYTEQSDARQEGQIAFAEYLSGTICDVCGNPGSTNEDGWLQTRCPAHKKEFIG